MPKHERVTAQALRKKKYPHREKFSIWYRILRFFFPKDLRGEFKKGMEMGKASGVARKLGGGLYELGRFARRKIDPEHKMKTGKQRK